MPIKGIVPLLPVVIFNFHTPGLATTGATAGTFETTDTFRGEDSQMLWKVLGLPGQIEEPGIERGSFWRCRSGWHDTLQSTL
jgi:hypothetical protein